MAPFDRLPNSIYGSVVDGPFSVCYPPRRSQAQELRLLLLKEQALEMLHGGTPDGDGGAAAAAAPGMGAGAAPGETSAALANLMQQVAALKRQLAEGATSRGSGSSRSSTDAAVQPAAWQASLGQAAGLPSVVAGADSQQQVHRASGNVASCQ